MHAPYICLGTRGAQLRLEYVIDCQTAPKNTNTSNSMDSCPAPVELWLLALCLVAAQQHNVDHAAWSPRRPFMLIIC